MKLIIFLLLMIPCAAIAQKKAAADTSKVKKVRYEKFVKINTADAQVFLNALNQWRALEPYNPNTTDQQKVNTVKELDAYIKRIVAAIKVDSVLIK